MKAVNEEKILFKNAKMPIDNFTGVMDIKIKGLEERGFIMEHELCLNKITARLLNNQN